MMPARVLEVYWCCARQNTIFRHPNDSNLVVLSFIVCSCAQILTTENVLHIRGGRHPLTEALVDTFIPNDTHMNAGDSRVHLVTGKYDQTNSCRGHLYCYH